MSTSSLPPPLPLPPPPPNVISQAVSSTNADVQLPPGVTLVSPWLRLGAYLLESLLVTVTFGIGWSIWAAMLAGTGQTPAKRLLGLRVIGADTMSPVGMGRMFWMRGLVAGMVAFFAILFTLGVLLFMPFWDRRNQNLWDKVSTTYVVTDPNDAWSTRRAVDQ